MPTEPGAGTGLECHGGCSVHVGLDGWIDGCMDRCIDRWINDGLKDDG